MAASHGESAGQSHQHINGSRGGDPTTQGWKNASLEIEQRVWESVSTGRASKISAVAAPRLQNRCSSDQRPVATAGSLKNHLVVTLKAGICFLAQFQASRQAHRAKWVGYIARIRIAYEVERLLHEV